MFQFPLVKGQQTDVILR